jgi:two-component SAPR family response regulator
MDGRSSVVAGVPRSLADRTPVLDISVLGRVDVRIGGASLRLGRAKSKELLVFLAMHRDEGGVDTDQLWEALWPGRSPSSAVLHTTVSVARRSVARGLGRRSLVSDARGGRVYELTGQVRLDCDELERLVVHAHACSNTGAVPVLKRALGLVRGIPFTSAAPGSYDWARGHRADMEQAIGAIAERLGDLLLQQGDVLGARRAARHGLRAAPYDERLYRVLLRVAHAARDAAGVERVMFELTEALGVDVDGVEHRTRDVYQGLRRASFG